MIHQDDPFNFDPEAQQLLEPLKLDPKREPRAAARGKAAFLAEARALRETVSPSWFDRLMGWFGLNHTDQEMTLMNMKLSGLTALGLIAIFLTILFGGGVATAYAARSALPGDALFPVKTVLEGAQVTFTPDAARDAELHMLFAERRLDEMAALIENGRFENLERTAGLFESHIQGAIRSLGSVAAQDPAKAEDLAFAIAAALSRYSRVLISLRDAAPDVAQTAIDQALLASQKGLEDEEQVKFTGVVESIADDVWLVDGTSVMISDFTEIHDGIVVGDLVEVRAMISMDGALTALEIEPSDGLDNTNDNANEDGAVRFTGIVESIGPDAWVVDGMTIGITPDTDIRDVIAVGDPVEVRAIENPDGTLTATRIELAKMKDEKVRFTGLVESIGPDSWVVDGQTILITPETEIRDTIVAGDLVEVRALRSFDGTLTATRIELADDANDNLNENANGNMNENINDNDNMNENANGNMNENINDNDNMNENDNDNDNDSSGSGKGGDNENSSGKKGKDADENGNENGD